MFVSGGYNTPGLPDPTSPGLDHPGLLESVHSEVLGDQWTPFQPVLRCSVEIVCNSRAEAAARLGGASLTFAAA